MDDYNFTWPRWLKFKEQQGQESIFSMGFFDDLLLQFGKVNIFAIAGAADLVLVRNRISVIDDYAALRARCRAAWMGFHTARFPSTPPENEQGRIRDRVKSMDRIWGIINGDDQGLSVGAYLAAMDKHADLLWHAEFHAGAQEAADFEKDYPVPQPLAQRIAAQVARVGPVLGCLHCGLPGHSARACPSAGSWSTDSQGRRAKYGGKPRCFVCSNYTRDHMSVNCPLRNPASREPVDRCGNSRCDQQGRFLVANERYSSTCTRCGHPMRCWNCGEQGHRLGQCTEPRYKPPAYQGKAPREERSA
uniref:CCHC-type domain-containing protein n=1 Tax=Globodera pallida TaxID=36090 RepID=A0A183BZK2_GLOPA